MLNSINSLQHLTSATSIALSFYFSSLPPCLGENNDGASTAFEGRLDGADGHSLGGVSGQLRVSSQLLEQLPVEGGCLGLPCYLNSEGPREWGRVGGLT